jgi:hypothetical protein
MLDKNTHAELPLHLNCECCDFETTATDDNLSFNRAMQSNPVVPPPTEHAANGAQCKQSQQAIERAQLGWFELHRIATRALSSYAKQMRQPVGPITA